MEKIIVWIEEYDDTECKEHHYLAGFTNKELRGMIESGVTVKEAFDELMISLKVKIAYDNNIDIS